MTSAVFTLLVIFCKMKLIFCGKFLSSYSKTRTQPELNPIPLRPSSQTSKWGTKVTCRDSSHGHKLSGKGGKGRGRGSRGKRSQMLSESRQENFGISITNITPCTVRSSRQPIDYLPLSDGYEDETPDIPK